MLMLMLMLMIMMITMIMMYNDVDDDRDGDGDDEMIDDDDDDDDDDDGDDDVDDDVDADDDGDGGDDDDADGDDGAGGDDDDDGDGEHHHYKESERIGYDHFTRRGYSTHALRTAKGEDELSCTEAIHVAVHAAHQKGKKLGPSGIGEIKTKHAKDSQTMRFPAAPDTDIIRPTLWSASEKIAMW